MTNDRKIVLSLLLTATWLAATTGRAQPDVLFIPASRGELYAADTYRSIWNDYGDRIVAALESRTCMPFAEPVVWARVAEAVSNSGGPNHPMRLRASYDREVKASTLVHELGHRHLWHFSERLPGVNTHMTLYLILDRVWADVWGDAFAARRIEGESVWDDEYENAWAWAQSLGVDRRTALWNRLLRLNGFDGYCYGPLDERTAARQVTSEPDLRLSDARSAIWRATATR